MKRIFSFLLTAALSLAAFAENIQTVVLTTTPQMHCQNCENKIKKNIRFVKGVKEITTSVKDQTVVIKYDADKAKVDDIQAAFKKIGFTATVKETDKK